MSTTHPLDDLKRYHHEAKQFFGSELILLKEAIPKIVDERLAKAALLLISSGQTGAALLQLAKQTDTFSSESVMLARAFMEKITNFCYVGKIERNLPLTGIVNLLDRGNIHVKIEGKKMVVL